MTSRPAIGLLACVGMAMLIVPACTATSSGSTTGSSTTTGTTATVADPGAGAGALDDGSLVIGAVLPSVGAAGEIGASMDVALTLALGQINSVGGVNGREVRLIVREEGDNTSTAAVAVQDLIQLGVDAIIGPTSSLAMLGTLSTAVEAGVLTCGPTASALSLDDFPDDGLFFRTVPSDSLQATALARVVESSGGRNAVVVYLDDAYGRPLADLARTAIALQGTSVVGSHGFVPSEASIEQAAQEVNESSADVAVVIADSVSGPAMVHAIDDTTARTVTFVVNDAIRRPGAAAQPFTGALADNVLGASPLAYPANTPFLNELHRLNPGATGLYAQNAYDCLNILALAALASGSSDAATMAGAVTEVTNNGTSCSDFASCRKSAARGRNIDYDGPSGTLSINGSGEMTSGVFERFGFDSTGRDVALGLLRIGD